MQNAPPAAAGHQHSLPIRQNLSAYAKKHRLRGAICSYGRGSWTRTNACGIQNPVPYQLGDTPVSLAAVNKKYYSGAACSCQQFFCLLPEFLCRKTIDRWRRTLWKKSLICVIIKLSICLRIIRRRKRHYGHQVRCGHH